VLLRFVEHPVPWLSLAVCIVIAVLLYLFLFFVDCFDRPNE